MVVRTMTTHDVVVVAELAKQLGYDVETATVESALAKTTDGTSVVLVAEGDESVTGWVHAFETVLLQYPHPFVEIGGLVVSDVERGTGVGRELMVAVEQWAISRGLWEIRLRSGSARTVSHAFYEHLGYVNEKSTFTFSKLLA